MNVHEFVRKILAGCGKERELIQAVSLFNDIAETYHRGEIDEATMEKMVTEMCEALVVYANQCGKSLTLDKCVEDGIRAVKETITPAMIMEKLRKMKAGRRGIGGGLEVL